MFRVGSGRLWDTRPDFSHNSTKRLTRKKIPEFQVFSCAQVLHTAEVCIHQRLARYSRAMPSCDSVGSRTQAAERLYIEVESASSLTEGNT